MYVFVGAGGIGASLAARLAPQAEVTIIDGWREHVDAINQSGLRLSLPNAEIVARVPASTFADATIPADTTAVMMSVKSYDTADTLEWLRPRLPAGVPVVSLQNGLNEAIIAAAIGEERTIGAVVMFDGILVGPAHALTHQPRATLTVGHWSDRPAYELSKITTNLARATPLQVVNDVRAALWEKLAINCMLNAPAAASGLPLRDLARCAAGRVACAEVAREAVVVSRAVGVRLAPTFLYGASTESLLSSPDGPAELAELLGRTFWDSELQPSMLTDVQRGRRTEIAALNGFIVEEGRRVGVPTPWNDHFCRVVSQIEAGSTTSDQRWLRP